MKISKFEFRNSKLAAAAVLLVALCSLPAAHAHPGRLDDKNCHRVTEDWKYESGKVLKAGTQHCHGKLNDTPLDGKQLLEDPQDQGRAVKQKKISK